MSDGEFTGRRCTRLSCHDDECHWDAREFEAWLSAEEKWINGWGWTGKPSVTRCSMRVGRGPMNDHPIGDGTGRATPNPKGTP